MPSTWAFSLPRPELLDKLTVPDICPHCFFLPVISEYQVSHEILVCLYSQYARSGSRRIRNSRTFLVTQPIQGPPELCKDLYKTNQTELEGPKKMSKAGIGTRRKAKAVPIHFWKKEEEAASFECSLCPCFITIHYLLKPRAPQKLLQMINSCYLIFTFFHIGYCFLALAFFPNFWNT